MTASRLAYDDAYFRSHYGHLWDHGRYARLSRYYKRAWFVGVDSAKPIFEFGCGLGVNIAWSSQAHGYDISPEARAFSRAKGVRVYDTMDEVPSAAFPIVISSHCLEHVEDPVAALRDMRRVLEVDGTLILAIPQEQHGPSSFEPDNDQHLYSWTFRTIDNLLLRCGFVPFENRVVWGPTGLTKLAALERLLGEELYLDTVQFLGRLRRNLPTLRVLARRSDGPPQPLGDAED